MEGAEGADGDRARGLSGESSAAEGDPERGSRYGLVRCASQSSLDESSQRGAGGAGAGAAGAAGGAGAAGEPAGAADAHAGALLGALARLRGAGALCDVRLVARADAAAAPGAPVAAHRAVLAAASPYFRAMFTQFSEAQLPEVELQGVEPGALAALVEWVYCPRALRVTERNVQALLAAGSLLALPGARDAAAAFLAAALQADNALGIRAFADLHACAELRRRAHDYVLAHFQEVMETEEFMALSSDTLAEIISSDRLVVSSEEVVLDAVARWAGAEGAEGAAGARGAALGALLAHVRLPLLARDVLLARAAVAPLAGAADVRVKDLLIEALCWHLAPAARRAAAAAGEPRARPRVPAARGALLVAGGQAPKAIRDAELLRLDGGLWTPAPPLPSRRCRAGLAVVDGRAYAVGGFNGTLRVRSVDVYDPATRTWSAGPPLGARRSTLGVAELAGALYAVGGFDGAAGLSSAEVLAPGAAAWRPVAGMAARRSSVGVAVLAGKLYAVGGYDGAARQCLQSVERYDPALDAWEPVADMALRRSGCGVGVAEGALYAVGGHDGPAVRRSVERYRPGGAWDAAPGMRCARRNAAVAAHLGRLYVVGGDDGAANLASVEVFDPAAEQWTLLPAAMAVGRSYAAVAVLERAPEDPP